MFAKLSQTLTWSHFLQLDVKDTTEKVTEEQNIWKTNIAKGLKNNC